MALVAALFYGVVTLVLLGLTAGLAQSLAKLSLDSTIQRDVRERVQASAFARSDTTLQLAWVIGGFVGIAHAADAAHRAGRGRGRADRVAGLRPGDAAQRKRPAEAASPKRPAPGARTRPARQSAAGLD